MEFITTGRTINNALRNFYCNIYISTHPEISDINSFNLYMNWKNTQLKKHGFEEINVFFYISTNAYNKSVELEIVGCKHETKTPLIKMITNYDKFVSNYNVNTIPLMFAQTRSLDMATIIVTSQLEMAMSKIDKEFTKLLKRFELIVKMSE